MYIPENYIFELPETLPLKNLAISNHASAIITGLRFRKGNVWSQMQVFFQLAPTNG